MDKEGLMKVNALSHDWPRQVVPFDQFATLHQALQYVLIPTVVLPLSGPVVTAGASVLPLPVFNSAPAPVGTDASEGQAGYPSKPLPTSNPPNFWGTLSLCQAWHQVLYTHWLFNLLRGHFTERSLKAWASA